MATGYNYSDFNLTMYRGDDEEFGGVVTEDDEITPVDITGWEIWFTAKTAILDADGSALFILETGAGITITDAVNGEYEISIAAALTDALITLSGEYFCDLQVKDLGGKVRTLLTGKLTIKAEITRTTA